MRTASKNKILITGGTGFIGSHLVNFLKKKKYNIVVLHTKKIEKLKKFKGVKYIKFNISSKREYKKINKQYFSHVINLAGYVNHKNKKKTFLSHYEGLKNLSIFFLNSKIKSFIQIGTGGEYGKLKSPHNEKNKWEKKFDSTYSKAKYLATKHLINLFKKKNFPCTILRVYQAYGPNQSTNRFLPILITNCLKNRKFDTSDGKQLRDFIYIKDLIKVIYKCLGNKKTIGQIINVGSGKPIRIKDIILIVQKICKGGLPQFGKVLLRKDESKIFYPDISTLRKILKFKPNISFKKGLKLTISSYMN